MWRNREVAGFAEWLHAFNASRLPEERVGIYGLDMYGLYASIGAVIASLERVDPAAARRARTRYEHLARNEEEPEAEGAPRRAAGPRAARAARR